MIITAKLQDTITWLLSQPSFWVPGLKIACLRQGLEPSLISFFKNIVVFDCCSYLLFQGYATSGNFIWRLTDGGSVWDTVEPPIGVSVAVHILYSKAPLRHSFRRFDVHALKQDAVSNHTEPFTPSVAAYKEQLLLWGQWSTTIAVGIFFKAHYLRAMNPTTKGIWLLCLILLLFAPFVRSFYHLFPTFSRKKSCENRF